MANRDSGQKGFTLIELLLVVAIMSLVAAIAVPNFLRYQAITRQAEARSNLGGVFVGEMSFWSENGRFSDFFDIGYVMQGATNRYTYRAQKTTQTGTTVSPGAIQVIPPGNGAPAQVDNTVVSAASSQFGFTATASANLDSDATLDFWHINDAKEGLRSPDINDVIN